MPRAGWSGTQCSDSTAIFFWRQNSAARRCQRRARRRNACRSIYRSGWRHAWRQQKTRPSLAFSGVEHTKRCRRRARCVQTLRGRPSARQSRATPTVAARRPGTPGPLAKARVMNQEPERPRWSKVRVIGRLRLNPRHSESGAARAKAPCRRPCRSAPAHPAPDRGRLFIDLE